MNTNIKKERFKRVAEKRTEIVIRAIRNLSKCSNKRNYDYSEDQLKKIWRVIDAELKLCKQNYCKQSNDILFKL